MNRLLELIKGEGVKVLPCERLNLDIERFNEYRDSEEHPVEEPFENPKLSTVKKFIDDIGEVPTILHYFLDGSRRTYKVADLITPDNRYFPIIAGQIGVAVMERSEGGYRLKPVKEFCKFENMIAFPDKINDEDLNLLENKINSCIENKFTLGHYRMKEGHDPVDLGIAKIMSRMHEIEVEAVQNMADRNMLRNDKMLVIDGPLRFKKKFDLHQFRNVIGLSKSFRPSYTMGKGRNKVDVGYITSTLKFKERTSVFKTMEEEKFIGMWYLRIRPTKYMTNPLQGVVKAEGYAVDPEDRENGFKAERIDILSAHIIRERNVTPYKADSRWAGHIYPVYMAESYLKSGFLSNVQFKGLF